MIFLDTSAIYALADKADSNHEKAKKAFSDILRQGEEFILHSYIIVESTALIQRRLGFAQAERFLNEVERFRVVWVDSFLHKLGRNFFKKSGKRKLSFVDCVSFTLMEKEGIGEVFAFDEDFAQAGFKLCPDI